VADAARLNADPNACRIDRAALQAACARQGADFAALIEARPHLFAESPLFVTTAHLEQMQAVIAAVESVVALPGWRELALQDAPAIARHAPRNPGVFFGYDFHLNAQGAHLIEINTNAGGGFLNAMLIVSQQGVATPGQRIGEAEPETAFLEMFRTEWRLQRGDAPLRTVAIVDENPREQYLYPEFLLCQRMFERAGITALIADPAELYAQPDGLYCGAQKIDLIYNRLTDFSLVQYPALAQAYLADRVVLTPHPYAYALYANKRNLARLTDPQSLRALGVPEETIAVLRAGIPETRIVRAEDAETWWAERKQWFFKPNSGYGSKGAYRGDKLTKRVFEEVMQSGYVAQRLAAPGERSVNVSDETAALKFDLRCYTYAGRLQLAAARLYQGQTTNFRTPGGGFGVLLR
jgi:hypothetical protein